MMRRSILGLLLLVLACTRPQVNTALDVTKEVLTIGEIACIMTSLLADPEAVLQACDMVEKANKVLPVVRNLIGVRDAGRRAGVHYADGGKQP